MIEACSGPRAGRDATACGNIGRSFPEVAQRRRPRGRGLQLPARDAVVHPVVSVLVNVATDLDWHGDDRVSRREGADPRRQRDDDVHVGNRDDAVAAELSSRARCRIRWFRRDAADDEVGYEDEVLAARIEGVTHRLGRSRRSGRLP